MTALLPISRNVLSALRMMKLVSRISLIFPMTAGDHFLQLLLLAALRHNHEKIENRKDKHERQKRPDETAAAAFALKI
jgi:hypothetical protein